jgi:hypothetical protein
LVMENGEWKIDNWSIKYKWIITPKR